MATPVQRAERTPTRREVELLALVVAERSGREIAKAYEARTGRRIPYSTVYTLAQEMRERGWVTIREEDEGDRRVRYIRLTRVKGAQALERARQRYRTLSEIAADALGELRT